MPESIIRFLMEVLEVDYGKVWYLIHVPSDQNSFCVFVQAEYIAQLLGMAGSILYIECLYQYWTDMYNEAEQ